MFEVQAIRNGTKFFQSFNSWNEANTKAKWLAENGFIAEVLRASVPKKENLCG